MYEGDLWIFAYGSLIWQPGFDFASKHKAIVDGYRRAFCMTSVHYRGTPEFPGLVLALDADPGTKCEGLAYQVNADHSADVLEYLRERELVSYAYEEVWIDIALDNGQMVNAVVYVTNRDHPQYSGNLDLDQQADVIARAVGPRGPNSEYLLNTVKSLEALDIYDADLHHLANSVQNKMN